MRGHAITSILILAGLACLATGPAQAINRGHVLEGIVTDMAGKPVVHAKVILSGGAYHKGPDAQMVRDQESQAAGDWQSAEIASSWTDEQGHYMLVDIPSGTWTLTIEKSGYSR